MQVYGLSPERIWVSVFEADDETFTLWRDVVGVSPERIRRMGAADNFWEAGPTGPPVPLSSATLPRRYLPAHHITSDHIYQRLS